MIVTTKPRTIWFIANADVARTSTATSDRFATSRPIGRRPNRSSWGVIASTAPASSWYARASVP